MSDRLADTHRSRPALPRLRTLLAGAAALAATVMLPVQAHAEPEIEFLFDGHVAAMAGFAGHDLSQGTDDFIIAGESLTRLRLQTTFDNGLRLGLRSRIDLRYAQPECRSAGVRNDDCAPEVLDELFVFVETGLGQVQLGLRDGVSNTLQYVAPTPLRSVTLNDPRSYLVETAFGGRGPYRPLRLRTLTARTDDSLKLVLLSPRLLGAQIGVSYAPSGDRSWDWQGNDLNEQSDVWEAGASYAGSFASFDLAFSAVVLAAQNERSGPAGDGVRLGVEDDRFEWGLGTNVRYKGITGGASIRWSNVAGGIGASRPLVTLGGLTAPATAAQVLTGFTDNSVETRVWEAGVLYETGPWVAGLNVIAGESAALDLTTAPDRLIGLEAKAGQISGTYAIAPTLLVGASVQHWIYEGDAPVAEQMTTLGMLTVEYAF